MPVIEFAQQIDRGRDFRASYCWVAGGVGVNFAGASLSALWRQRPVDAPLVQVSSVPSANGSIVVLPAIPVVLNGVFWGEVLENFQTTANPVQVALTAAGAALLTVAYCQWSLTVTWPDGTQTDWMHGPVTIESV